MATASQSLYNMTVATDNAGGNQGLLMPKLAYRFRVNFINFGVSGTSAIDLTKQVVDVTRPQLTFTEIPLPVYNSTIYLAGRHDWQAITTTFRDDATGSVSKLLGAQVQKQLDFVEQASAASGQDYKFQVNIQSLDGGNGLKVPQVLETWELYGCFIQSVNYNQMAYGTNDAVTISVTIRYDNAIQAPLGSGIGTDVGRTLGSIATGIGASI